MSEIPGPYKQFLLFGDSITEMSYNSRNGFAFGAELSSGKLASTNTLTTIYYFNMEHKLLVLSHFCSVSYILRLS